MSPPRPTQLTSHLLALDPSSFKEATQTPFLRAAGAGTLSKDILQTWLSQDRLYAQAYVRFAAMLLANVKLNGTVDGSRFEERLLDLILSSINNVRRELKFFEDVASRYDLDISSTGANVSTGVNMYQELFSEVGEAVEKGNMGMLEGMVLLWGTEICYLTAWRYASSCSHDSLVEVERCADGGALRKEFIPNWTSDDFAAFVDEIAGFADALWGMEIEDYGEKLKIIESIWKRVLDVEKEFWPVVG
ncbi:hypothetical protein VTL71DRAFT_1633 [Oculimacula yallundae]|uniref:Thiaminase-2/PQQC domain-containing protein n=1 Tax=Oculimacula yallundae TaxID=86028 RepID=A0ABR4CB85_9HELO